MAIVTFLYTFSSVSTPPPTSNQVRISADRTHLWLTVQTTDGIDVYRGLIGLPVGTRVYVQDKNDHTLFQEFTTTAAAIDAGTYVDLPVAAGTGGGAALNNNQAVVVVVESPAVTPSPAPGGGGSVSWPVPTVPSAGALAVVVVTASAPLFSRAEAKTRAGLDWVDGDPRDALVDGFVRSAQRAIETETGLVPLVQDIECYLGAFPLANEPILLPRRPVVTVEALSWTDGSGIVQAIDPTSLILDPGTAQTPARLALGAGGSWPAGGAPFPPITVRLTVGYADVTALEVAAPEVLDAAGVHIAHAANAGRDRFTDANRRDEFCALLNPYQLVTVP